MKITSPIFFLLVGFFIVVCFIFIPQVYDPIIMRILPMESIDKDQQLIDYLSLIQSQNNIIIGVHGYTHKSPVSGSTICEYSCPDEDIPNEIIQERIEKGIDVFERAGLDAYWIVPPGMSYGDEFLDITKALGYMRVLYFLESPGGFKNALEMVIKPEALEKINKYKERREDLAIKEGNREELSLAVDFFASPAFGEAPLNNVDLTVLVSGTATGDIIYKFDCTNDGTWEKVQTTNSTRYTIADLCGYASPGFYTAKVRVEREGVRVEGTTRTVASSLDGSLTIGELKNKIKETKDLITRLQIQLTELPIDEEAPLAVEDHIVFKEYTWEWGRKTINSAEYKEIKKKLEEDMRDGVNGILLHIQDYNDHTELFLRETLKDNQDIKFVRVDDIASSYDLARVKKLVDLVEDNDRLLFMAVIPAHVSGINSIGLSFIIKITWIVFVFFFLFPLAVMLPLHWYERGKIRRTTRVVPDSPKVSLILPAYNEEKFIGKSIEQGLKQDYKGELEIVIIDDGSTDKTFEIANKYTKTYSNVKLYKHDKNMGKPAGLNTGFHRATGEISIFSDTDSHLDSDLVSKMVPHFDDPKVGAVAGMIIIDNEINLLTRLQQIEYLYNQEIVRFCQEVHRGVLICPGAATAVRTQIGRDIPSTERTITEDADFTFEVAKAGWKVRQEPEAISRTDAPDNWKEFINQRKRWLYGVLQTIWIHKWAVFFKGSKVPNPWVWWAWIGYITCPITTLAVIAMPLFVWLIGPSYLIFLGFYSLLIVAIYGFAHWYGIRQYTHSNKTKLILLLPVYMVYQYILNVLLFYLVIAFILRKGITVRYGGRDIHAV